MNTASAGAMSTGSERFSLGKLARTLSVMALVSLVVCAIAGKADGTSGWRDLRAFSDDAVRLPTQAARVETADGVELRLVEDGRAAELPYGLRGSAVLKVFAKDGTAAPSLLRVSIVDRAYGLLALFSGIAICLCLPWMLVPRGATGSLTSMLVENGGGLSLARLQLLLWFLPTIGIATALSVPLLEFPPLEGSFAALFGLSGLTTILSGAASPLERDTVTPPSALRQVVEDWQGELDVSRLQLLAVTGIGVFVVIAAFVGTMHVPAISQGWLHLLGASQFAYVGVKAVKQGAAKPSGASRQAGVPYPPV
jgi:hypothetical protein